MLMDEGGPLEFFSTQEESGQKRRRPPNAYILYCLEKRTGMRAQYPDLPNIEITRILSEQWKALEESEETDKTGINHAAK